MAAEVSASRFPFTGAVVPFSSLVPSAKSRAPVGSTTSTRVVNRPGATCEKMIVTLLGRASGGAGNLEVSTAHVPNSGETNGSSDLACAATSSSDASTMPISFFMIFEMSHFVKVHGVQVHPPNHYSTSMWDAVLRCIPGLSGWWCSEFLQDSRCGVGAAVDSCGLYWRFCRGWKFDAGILAG